MSLKVIRFLIAVMISLAFALMALPALANDASNVNIKKPWIKVISPNGGETLTAGDVFRITWESSAKIEKVSIWYKSCFICFHRIAVNLPNTGYYDWNVDVGSLSRTQFTIYLIGYEKGRRFAFDQSDASFTVLPFVPPTPTPTLTPDLTDSICVTIKADVAEVYDPGSVLNGAINPGDKISGTYIYNLYSPDEDPDPSTGRYHFTGAPVGIILNVNGLTFRTMPDSVNIFVEILNDVNVNGNPPSDHYTIESYINSFDKSVSPEANNTIAWQLEDTTANALSSDALPAGPPVLTDWQSVEGLTIESLDNASGAFFFIRAHATSAYTCGQIPTDVPTSTLTSTPTDTPTETDTPTDTPTPTETPTPTITETPVPTETVTPTITDTPVPTETVTSTPTPTLTGG